MWQHRVVAGGPPKAIVQNNLCEKATIAIFQQKTQIEILSLFFQSISDKDTFIRDKLTIVHNWNLSKFKLDQSVLIQNV